MRERIEPAGIPSVHRGEDVNRSALILSSKLRAPPKRARWTIPLGQNCSSPRQLLRQQRHKPWAGLRLCAEQLYGSQRTNRRNFNHFSQINILIRPMCHG